MTNTGAGIPHKHTADVGKRIIGFSSRAEEIANTATHGAAASLGCIGLFFLILKAHYHGALAVAGAIFFGASLILLYLASTLYHATCISRPEGDRLRSVMQKCDHVMIFLLILGTYVPACWTALGGWCGWTVFSVVGTCSLLGMALSWISVERFEKICLILNIISGWTIVIASIPYYNAIGPIGFNFLVAGGLFYTFGIIFYKMDKVPFMHVVWHLFVMLGSVMHFVMIYNFVY